MIKSNANINNLKLLISKNQVDLALSNLKIAIDKNNDKELINDFHLLSNQYAQFKRKDRLQLPNEITNGNRIIFGILELIDLATESEKHPIGLNSQDENSNLHSKKKLKHSNIKEIYENNMDYLEKFHSLNKEISEIIFSQKKDPEEYTSHLKELENQLQQLSVLRHKMVIIKDEILVPYWMPGDLKRSSQRMIDWFENGISFSEIKTLNDQVDLIIIKGEKSKNKQKKIKLMYSVFWGIIVLLFVCLFVYISLSFF